MELPLFILGFGGLRIKASSILVLDWLGTKALYNFEIDVLRIKASSLVELNGLRLNMSSIHLGAYWVKKYLTTEALFILGFGGLRIKASIVLVLDWLRTKAPYNLGLMG